MGRNLFFTLIDGLRTDLCYGERGTSFNQAIATQARLCAELYDLATNARNR
jgi:hypothetical protein